MEKFREWVCQCKKTFNDRGFWISKNNKVIEKAAFNELMRIAEDMEKEVFCAKHEGAVCAPEKPCFQCQLLDKFQSFKQKLGGGE